MSYKELVSNKTTSMIQVIKNLSPRKMVPAGSGVNELVKEVSDQLEWVLYCPSSTFGNEVTPPFQFVCVYLSAKSIVKKACECSSV